MMLSQSIAAPQLVLVNPVLVQYVFLAKLVINCISREGMTDKPYSCHFDAISCVMTRSDNEIRMRNGPFSKFYSFSSCVISSCLMINTGNEVSMRKFFLARFRCVQRTRSDG